jgi:hypothetical protein
MKLRYVLPCAVALFGLGMADAQSVSTSSIPRLEKRGQATQLIVDGRPFLILAGELTNSASSSMAHLRQFAAEDLCNSLILLARAVSDAKM